MFNQNVSCHFEQSEKSRRVPWGRISPRGVRQSRLRVSSSSARSQCYAQVESRQAERTGGQRAFHSPRHVPIAIKNSSTNQVAPFCLHGAVSTVGHILVRVCPIAFYGSVIPPPFKLSINCAKFDVTLVALWRCSTM